ncbi:VOC family protein [Enterobacter sp. SA187]|uniref:VOC family protein n=1 Tax=Enterobacter sp. SA187 TaxID=1914861 RepID=UPI000ACEDDD7|nr:VOC family protein [Enterobacter sp. SA187]
MLQALNHITLAVSNVSRSFDFYVKTPGFTPAAKWARAENIPATRWNFSNIRSGLITRGF